jgi:hypothetical protein
MEPLEDSLAFGDTSGSVNDCRALLKDGIAWLLMWKGYDVLTR